MGTIPSRTRAVAAVSAAPSEDTDDMSVSRTTDLRSVGNVSAALSGTLTETFGDGSCDGSAEAQGSRDIFYASASFVVKCDGSEHNGCAPEYRSFGSGREIEG